jgi:hypothetical protein
MAAGGLAPFLAKEVVVSKITALISDRESRSSIAHSWGTLTASVLLDGSLLKRGGKLPVGNASRLQVGGDLSIIHGTRAWSPVKKISCLLRGEG